MSRVLLQVRRGPVIIDVHVESNGTVGAVAYESGEAGVLAKVEMGKPRWWEFWYPKSLTRRVGVAVDRATTLANQVLRSRRWFERTVEEVVEELGAVRV